MWSRFEIWLNLGLLPYTLTLFFFHCDSVMNILSEELGWNNNLGGSSLLSLLLFVFTETTKLSISKLRSLTLQESQWETCSGDVDIRVLLAGGSHGPPAQPVVRWPPAGHHGARPLPGQAGPAARQGAGGGGLWQEVSKTLSPSLVMAVTGSK